jgi:predicted DNA-binding transcriptional regulator AlpA
MSADTTITVFELLRMDEVSDLTGVPLATLRFWRHLGTGPQGFRLGRRVVYDRAEVSRWINDQRRQGGVSAR